MYIKDRVCSPLPQISISCLPESFALITFRQTAAGAFSLSLELYQHGVPPVCFLRGAGISSPIGGSQPRY